MKDVDDAVPRAGLIGVGYQGHNIDEFVSGLVSDRVSRLVDVRLTPISRKPGFSKTVLRRALESAGLAYEHHRELGNPKDNRPGFAAGISELERARDTYRGLLAAPAATAVLRRLAELSGRERVALLCFEADQSRCHRDLVIDAVKRLRLSAAGGTRRRC